MLMPACDCCMPVLQVINGQLVNQGIMDPSMLQPDCCPGGVFLPDPPMFGCGCADNKLDSPFRLVVGQPSQGANNAVQWNYKVFTVNTQVSSRVPGSPALTDGGVLFGMCLRAATASMAVGCGCLQRRLESVCNSQPGFT